MYNQVIILWGIFVSAFCDSFFIFNEYVLKSIKYIL